MRNEGRVTRGGISACGEGECPAQTCDDYEPLRQSLFGDTHVHTFLSFDASQRAYYYARVIENPKCRWSQHACNAAGVNCSLPATVTEGFEECCDLSGEECASADVDCSAHPVPAGLDSCGRPRVLKTIQERAWTSPVWYSP